MSATDPNRPADWQQAFEIEMRLRLEAVRELKAARERIAALEAAATAHVKDSATPQGP